MVLSDCIRRPNPSSPTRQAHSYLSVALHLLLLTGSVLAQEVTDAPFVDRLDVQLVIVDVVVEENGRPVVDLDREAFHVYEDGEEVELRSFVAPEAANPPSASASGRQDRGDDSVSVADQAPGERLVLFLDELHLNPNHRKKVLLQVRDALKRRLGPGDQAMLARFDGQVRVIQPFTDDFELLDAALLEESRATRVSFLAQMADTEKTLQYLQNNQFMNTTRRGDPCTEHGLTARTHAQQAYSMVMQSLNGLHTLVGSLARVEGRKTLIHVSDGVPLTPGTEVYGYAAELCDGTGASLGVENAIDTSLLGSGKNTRWDPTKAELELQEFDTSSEWRKIAALANSKEVSVYPLQALGLMSPRSAGVDSTIISMRSELAGRHDARDALFLLADQTGGRPIFDTNKFDDAVEEILSESDAVYRLAYAPPAPGDGKEHRIEVRVDRPGVTVRHRKSYFSQNGEQRIADEVLATLVHGDIANPLGARLEAALGEIEERRRMVKLTIDLPLDALTTLPQEQEQRGQFTVFVAAREDGDRFTPVGKRVFPVVVTDDPARDSYRYEIEIRLRGKQASVAVAIRDDVGGDVSYLRREMTLDGE